MLGVCVCVRALKKSVNQKWFCRSIVVSLLFSIFHAHTQNIFHLIWQTKRVIYTVNSMVESQVNQDVVLGNALLSFTCAIEIIAIIISEPKPPKAIDTSIDTDIVYWKWKVNYESNMLHDSIRSSDFLVLFHTRPNTAENEVDIRHNMFTWDKSEATQSQPNHL